jgi:hypothetical protein
MSLSYFDQQLFEVVVTKNFPKEKLEFSKGDILMILNEMSNTDKYYSKDTHETKIARHKVFKYFVRYCLYRNLANFDSLVLLTGEKGVGKSSFAMMLCREWCKLLGIPFRPAKYIAYTNRQVQNLIDTLPKFSPMICDEAINFATTENWAKTENKELKKKLGQVRTKHFFYILCFPLKVQKVDKVYLESYVNYWIECISRGLGALFVKDKNPVQDAWRLADFKNIGSYTEFTNLTKVKKALMRHPNFWYMITAPKPPDALYTEYLLHREKNVYSEAGVLSSVTRQDIYRAVMIKVLQDIMIRDSSLSMKRLLLHIKNEYDIDLRESDLKGIIEDAEMLIAQIKDEGKVLDNFNNEVVIKKNVN